MFKRFFLSLAIAAGLLSPALGAGTISLSLSQQFDSLGAPLNGGKIYFIQAGTTSTPQNAYQDSALTIPWPNPITLDSAGRVPQLHFADGNIKVRITNAAGVVQVTADNILVVGASSGGGGGGTVDATTILASGDLKVRYGTGTLSGFVRANGRTIGSATSGASERANADCQALFEYLWGADANLSVSTGRGVSAAADWAANKTIALPDWRGRALAGLDDMGNSAASRITAASGITGTTLGASGGEQTRFLVTSNLPAYTPAGTLSIAGTVNLPYNAGVGYASGGGFTAYQRTNPNANDAAGVTFSSSTFTGTAQGGTSAAFAIMPPVMLATVYLKL